jgi:D-aminopeptidase
MTTGRVRARELGIAIGRLPPGRWNAITDVGGVRVGHATVVAGEGALVVGRGPVRTGVTVVVPRDSVGREPVFAGWHSFNGAGEMTGLAWVEESGLLTTPVALTNTHSVGVVRDALIAHDVARGTPFDAGWSLPVVAETYDGRLNDINGMHVRPEHVASALETAATGPVAEGAVGGGTGMICHGFKGGIGTASRVLPADEGGYTVGVLVQANYGDRRLFRVDGVPVGEAIPESAVPLPGRPGPPGLPGSPDRPDGSIIAVVATDAPVLPTQCRRLAQRATVGLARAGGIGANGSGDLFLAFSTANAGLQPPADPHRAADPPVAVRMLPNRALTPLFEAVAEATEEAIVNALCMAATTTGIDGVVAHALPLDRFRAVMRRAGRLQG